MIVVILQLCVIFSGDDYKSDSSHTDGINNTCDKRRLSKLLMSQDADNLMLKVGIPYQITMRNLMSISLHFFSSERKNEKRRLNV